MPDTPLLIVNADDFGSCHERDASITELFLQRRITSASLLVNAPHARDAALFACQHGLPLGLHINLTEWQPVCKSAASITHESGEMYGKSGLRERLEQGLVLADDIRAEIRAQFALFCRLTGLLPSHVDGHTHVHVEPLVASVLLPLMCQEFGVYRLRLPIEEGPHLSEFQRRIVFHARQLGAQLVRHNLTSTEAFLGMDDGGERMQTTTLLHKIIRSPARSIELMTHPGLPSTHGDDFNTSPARLHEHRVLASPEFRTVLDACQSSGFADLPGQGSAGAPRLLIYSKLTHGTGNLMTALRLQRLLGGNLQVMLRHCVLDNPLDEAAAQREARDLARFAQQENIRFVLGINAYRTGSVLKHSGLPYALMLSGTDINGALDQAEKREAMRDAVLHADFLVSLSHAMQQRLSAAFRNTPPVHLIPQSVDIQPSGFSLRRALGLTDGQTLVLLPAGMRPAKDPLFVLEACATALAHDFPSHVLVLIGPALDPEYAQSVRQSIDHLVGQFPVLQGRLQIHPGLPHEDFLAALGEAALIINSSRSEGLPGVLVEAICLGTPCLVREIEGNREVITHDINGLTFATPEEFLSGYQRIFREEGLVKRLTRAGQQRCAQHFSPQREAAAYRAALGDKIGVSPMVPS